MKAYEIEKILRDDEIWADCYETDGTIKIELDGDWKHDHLRMVWVLDDYGIKVAKTYEEEGDCDWYYAEYEVVS